MAEQTVQTRSGLVMRPLRDDDQDTRRWSNLVGRVFQQRRIDDAELARRRARLRTERISVVEDVDHAGDPTLVAAFRSFDTAFSLPGGALVPANAISGVVVSPPHKRRGLLTDWITRDLAAAAERGAVASALYASETTIYGRYGFGMATGAASWALHTAAARFRAAPTGRLVALEADQARTVAEQIYPVAQQRCAGSIGRTDFSWQVFQGIAGDPDRGPGLWFVVHLDDADTPDGVVCYTLNDDWRDGISNSRLDIQDLLATNESAERALWQHCAGVDFAKTVAWQDGSPGYPLPHWLIDSRAAVSGRSWDGVWIRIHDVAAALSARQYPFAGDLRLMVREVDGTEQGFQLIVDESGHGSCQPSTDGQPDLTIGIADLGSLWLGGDVGVPRLAAMDVTLDGRRSLPWIQALFGWPTAPMSLTHF